MRQYRGQKVLIMGANPETVSLILKAKEMGIYTIVTDNNPNAFAKAYADKAYNIDATDVESLVELAKKEKVDGVLVGVAESLLPAYCKVCEQLKMPCYSTIEKFNIMVNKDFFKEKCREYNVPTIEEYSIEKMDEIKYPVIVKPVDSCSSKGITVCHNIEELKEGIKYAISYSDSGKYIIEKYMMGDEVISYYVIQDGNPIFVAMCDRYTYKGNSKLVQLPTCYIYPSRHIESYIKNTDKVVKDMIKNLGLYKGSIFFQAFVDNDGVVRIYEPGYRLNGAQEHIIVSKVSGIDAKELYINLALTGKVSDKDLYELSNPLPDKISCKLSPLVKTGIIAKLNGLDQIKRLEDVVSVNPSYNEGDEVTGEGTLKQIVCRFFIVSDTKEKLINTINNIYDLLEVKDNLGRDMLIGKFDPSNIEDLY